MSASKRRGRGEGSIRRRTDGRWEGSVELETDAGGRKRRSVYGRTRAETAAKIRRLQSEVAAGRPVIDERTRLGDFLDTWLEEVVKPKRSHGHWRNCESHIRLHIKPVVGRVPLAKLSPADVERLLNGLRAKRYSDDTVRLVHATLRAALTVARRWRMVRENVATLVEPVSVRRIEVQPFSEEEVGRLLEAARTDRLGAYLTVALALGLRPGEARALRWDDIDLDGPYPNVRIRAAFRRTAGGHGLAEPKARSRRTVALPEECTSSLREHQRRQQKERLAAGEDWQDGGFVFTTTTGHTLSESAVARWFARLRSEVGIDHGRLYDCRHTAASLLLAQGVHPRVIMDVLGHSTFRLTMDTYAHVLPATLREAASAMDAALAGASKAAGVHRNDGPRGNPRGSRV
jgi:integrase